MFLLMSAEEPKPTLNSHRFGFLKGRFQLLNRGKFEVLQKPFRGRKLEPSFLIWKLLNHVRFTQHEHQMTFVDTAKELVDFSLADRLLESNASTSRAASEN